MRRSAALPALPADAPAAPRSDAATLRRLLPFLWQYRWRVGIALAFMLAAKGANVGVPVLLKQLVDGLSIKPGDPAALLVVPVGLLLAYGALRLSTTLFTEPAMTSLGVIVSAVMLSSGSLWSALNRLERPPKPTSLRISCLK